MLHEIPLERVYGDLEALINSEDNKELECRNYLQFAKELLVRDTVTRFEYVETERRGNSGNPDYVISGHVIDENGIEAVRAYVWELKAPQCYLFKKETENRLIPSQELYEAENQLLHYYHELKGSDQFRHEFRVTHPDNVRFGGIIIGTQNRRVSGNFPDVEKRKLLYERAITIRNCYLYDLWHIRIITWDQILAQVKRISPSPREYKEIDSAITAKSDITEHIEIITL